MKAVFTAVAVVAPCVVVASGFATEAPLSDPFDGSGCNCSAFCDYECSINATRPTNLTLYRMTPFDVLDLTNKNTADVPGDVSFVISRRAMAYQCKINPDSYGCNTMVQFQGDDPNSTDLVLEMTVEVDGQWGMCSASLRPPTATTYACSDSRVWLCYLACVSRTLPVLQRCQRYRSVRGLEVHNRPRQLCTNTGLP